MSEKFGFLKQGISEGGPPSMAEPKSPRQEPRRRGRPRGKRSDPNFEQVTIYIRKTTHKKSKMKLLAAEEKQEFSELVENLVGGWLRA